MPVQVCHGILVMPPPHIGEAEGDMSYFLPLFLSFSRLSHLTF
jgi:hypothetical protein